MIYATGMRNYTACTVPLSPASVGCIDIGVHSEIVYYQMAHSIMMWALQDLILYYTCILARQMK